jgi:hypothetical protein
MCAAAIALTILCFLPTRLGAPLRAQSPAGAPAPRSQAECKCAGILPARCNSCAVQDLLTCTPLIKGKECVMSVQLLVIYPPPKDPAEFDRAYLQEHLPYAGPRLVGLGATGVSTKRVLGAPGGKPFAHTLSFVAFPNAETAKTCAQSKGGQEALQHAASISTGGPPQFLLIDDAP